jgi:hypothetical protein
MPQSVIRCHSLLVIERWTKRYLIGALSCLLLLGCVGPALADIRVSINLPSRRLVVFNATPEGNKVLHTYAVGVGRPGFPSPVGQFSIISKVKNPAWQNPYQPIGKSLTIPAGASNPLGTRWMGFKATPLGEYGMHGTDNPKSVGKLASHGCVRMRIAEAEALFELVSEKTPVAVTYERFALTAKPLTDQTRQVWLSVYPDVYGWTAKGKSPALLPAVLGQLKATYPGFSPNPVALQSALTGATEKPVLLGTWSVPQAPTQVAPPFAEATPQQETPNSTVITP